MIRKPRFAVWSAGTISPDDDVALAGLGTIAATDKKTLGGAIVYSTVSSSTARRLHSGQIGLPWKTQSVSNKIAETSEIEAKEAMMPEFGDLVKEVKSRRPRFD
jgi:hypothetical protein